MDKKLQYVCWTETPNGQEPREFTDEEFRAIHGEWAKRCQSGNYEPLGLTECEAVIRQSRYPMIEYTV
ncbi:hypothetical protein SAMN05421753_112122 [Planctomicrobium piriforme]|uniref:Uncharacterized protein n=1 Tax=Planctomicrobium piriforme TaxID=1576369 RepID=A0A1I3L3P9_9PLAN|nr:hypothetical protein SAMN05421753_112122 [Planctomicrobium piriforme]